MKKSFKNTVQKTPLPTTEHYFSNALGKSEYIFKIYIIFTKRGLVK